MLTKKMQEALSKAAATLETHISTRACVADDDEVKTVWERMQAAMLGPAGARRWRRGTGALDRREERLPLESETPESETPEEAFGPISYNII